MSSVRNASLAPQSTGDTPYNVRDAALRGASLAFSKPPAQPKPQANTYTGGSNGALLAATKVGTPVQRDSTGGSSRSLRRPSASPMQTPSKHNSSNSLSVPDDQFDRTPSPSNIAAKLAAARHSPLRPRPQSTSAPTMSEQRPNEQDVLPPAGSVGSVLSRLEPKKPVQQPQKRRDSFGSRSSASTLQIADRDHKPTDDTPIPPTTSLVKMFEQNRPTTPTTRPVAPMKLAQNSPPPVRSPKPQRAFKLPPEPRDDAPLQRVRTRTPPPVKPKPQHRIELPPPMATDGANEATYFHTQKQGPMKSPPIKQKPVQLAAIRTSTPPPPKPPPQRGTRQTRPQSQDMPHQMSMHRRLSTSLDSHKAPSSPSSFKSAKEEQDVEEKPKPALPPPRRSTTRAATSVPVSAQSRLTEPIQIKSRNQSQNPSAKRPTERFSPTRRPVSAMGGSSSPSLYHNNYQRESVKEITKHMTGESLSSAIMGAALAATSRNVSPAPRPMSIEPLFPPPKKHHHHPFHRSPSPQKQSPPKSAGKMRTTLRKEPSSSEDTDEVDKYKKKGTRIMGIKARKHPNKHHEATRKRWRDQITERERKRYEGVWAANKGLYLPSAQERPLLDDDPSLDVLNLLVREIWTRSRLPTHVLEEVWDLVDGRGVGRLTRLEFVVGLWLIDQRLKGRKLPVKISESVWQSARGIGLKVRNPR
ncbi:hypothetical protein T440DRAFT_467533 [Plenodomus tracheiphilus IPT5]|uniref:EH domain-containing protein n=1 Tax=Plenodomus tracheiphilus IPT5 TaxID=1408161 RepID=A0A6A7B8F8_9PLEO|nr:hypothetical protein T440DRAFT_467533 [Plenodomus tracheiphilus IPT5]